MENVSIDAHSVTGIHFEHIDFKGFQIIRIRIKTNKGDGINLSLFLNDGDNEGEPFPIRSLLQDAMSNMKSRTVECG